MNPKVFGIRAALLSPWYSSSKKRCQLLVGLVTINISLTKLQSWVFKHYKTGKRSFSLQLLLYKLQPFLKGSCHICTILHVMYGFYTVKREHEMLRTNSQMHSTDKFLQYSSIIWPVLVKWLSVRLWTKWLGVRFPLQSLKLQK